MILVLGKARSHWAPNLGCRGAESPGWFEVSPENSARDVMHEQACCRDEAANHQLPIAAAFWIIQIVCEEECSNLMAKFNADSLLYSLSDFECDSHTVHMLIQGIYHPHWLVSEVIIVHACTFQSTLLGCQFTSMSHTCSHINSGWTLSGQTSYIIKNVIIIIVPWKLRDVPILFIFIPLAPRTVTKYLLSAQ